MGTTIRTTIKALVNQMTIKATAVKAINKVISRAAGILVAATAATRTNPHARLRVIDRAAGSHAVASKAVAAMAVVVKADAKAVATAAADKAVVKAAATVAKDKAVATAADRAKADMVIAAKVDARVDINKVAKEAADISRAVGIKVVNRAGDKVVGKADINKAETTDKIPGAGINKVDSTKAIDKVAAGMVAIAEMSGEMIEGMTVSSHAKNAFGSRSLTSSRKTTSYFWSTSPPASQPARANPPHLLIWSRNSQALASA